MLTRILHNSPQLCALFNQLNLELYRPASPYSQYGRCAVGLRGREDHRSLAEAIRRSARCFEYGRLSAHQPMAGKRGTSSAASTSSHLANRSRGRGAPKIIYINIDNSLGEKDKDTRHLEPVDWHFNHSESTRSKPRFKNAFCFIVCPARIGQNVATVAFRFSVGKGQCVGSIGNDPKKSAFRFAANTASPVRSWKPCARSYPKAGKCMCNSTVGTLPKN